jgi:hypothetical protein
LHPAEFSGWCFPEEQELSAVSRREAAEFAETMLAECDGRVQARVMKAEEDAVE